MVINTEFEDRTVEIEGKEYTVAERTVETQEKLEKLDMNQPQYKRMIAAIEVLIGRDAVKALFTNGKKENIDRVEAIFHGCFEIYEKNATEYSKNRRQEQVNTIAESVEPFNKFLELATRFSKQK